MSYQDEEQFTSIFDLQANSLIKTAGLDEVKTLDKSAVGFSFHPTNSLNIATNQPSPVDTSTKAQIETMRETNTILLQALEQERRKMGELEVRLRKVEMLIRYCQETY